MERQRIERALQILTGTERPIRWAIIGYACALLIVIVLSVHVSTLELAFGSVCYGSRTLWRGHDAAFRIVALEPRRLTMVDTMRARITVRDQAGHPVVFREAQGPIAEINVPIPTTLELIGARADVEVHTSYGVDRFTLPVTVAPEGSPGIAPPGIAHAAHATPGAIDGTFTPDLHDLFWLPRHQPTSTGPYHVELFAQAGEVIAGMPNHLYGQITQNGQPVMTVVENRSMGLHVSGNALGLFEFDYTPPMEQKPLTLSVGTPPHTSEITWPINSKPTQIMLSVSPDVIAKSGGTIDVTVRTLPYRKPIYVDMILNDTVVLSTSLPPDHENPIPSADPMDRGRRMTLPIPADAHGWLLITAYRNVLTPQESFARQLVWVSPQTAPGAALDEAIASVRTHNLLLVPSQAQLNMLPLHLQEQALRVALTRFQPRSKGAPLLHSTLQTRLSAFKARQHQWRTWINGGLLVLVTVGLIMMVTLVLKQQRQTRRSMHTALQEAIDAKALDEDTDLHGITALKHSYEFGLIVLTIVMFAYCVYLLLSSMRWE